MTEVPFSVTLLGTSVPAPSIDQFGISTLVQAGSSSFVFDCGRGVTQRLSQLRIPWSQVDRLFLTHLHSDHVIGIPDLWLTGWIYGRHTPLQVWGPKGTLNMMQYLERAYEFDIGMRRDIDEKFPGEGVSVSAQDIVQEGVVYEEDGAKITAFEVDHGPVEPAFGYRIDYKGRSVVLSGDTRYSDNLIEYSRGVDLLVHEVITPGTFSARNPTLTQQQLNDVIAHHTTPEEAGEVFAKVGPKLAVYTHIRNDPESAAEMIEGTRKSYDGPLEIGEDLMTIDVGAKVEVRR